MRAGHWLECLLDTTGCEIREIAAHHDFPEGREVTSSVLWLDTSTEEQRATREMLALFTQSDSRDELGIGQIRDAFSECLFPGTSVLQTRARYFLIVPWLFTQGTRRGLVGSGLRAWVEQRERRLIQEMRRAGQVDGLIGRIAGPNVKVLPSTIYWSGLARYGVLRRDVAPNRLGAAGGQEADDELAERRLGDWHPTLPPAPATFPSTLEGGFDLTNDEASWLGERMRSAASGTLLEHLLARGVAIDPTSSAPWQDASADSAAEPVGRVLKHAELFSLTMQGAALLYNLLVGERYEDAGYTRVGEPVETFRERLAQWADECQAQSHELAAWDRTDLWSVVLSVNPRIGYSTRLFVRAWIDAVIDDRTPAAADDAALRRLARDREIAQKGGQARLSNAALLKSWSGEAGTGRLVYRWTNVRRLVNDVAEGLVRSAGA
ncbi:MAG: hypothetical protein IPJ14_19030 [Kineosporiaceae bacterium]|nr:hypothetical protein [Kineosporiaceae bacterium]MBK7624686.1 hypothetical protein [Kineosporiaceae bacterium]MBK8076937.1 hypothetical protein [Kineosporiaceae bacterium]